MLARIKELFQRYPVADHRDVHIFSIYFPDGFTGREIEKLKKTLQSADFKELLQPSTIQAYYAITKDSQEKILLDRKQLQILQEANDIRQFVFGESCGECLGEFTSSGLLTCSPLGLPVTEASRNARKHAEIA